MEVAAPTDAQGARTLSRSEILHRGVKLSCFSQGEPGLHPGGLFSDVKVMAAMTMVAIMTAKCLNLTFDVSSTRANFDMG